MSQSNWTPLTKPCPKCDGGLNVGAQSAVHDDNLIDLTVKCESCDYTLIYFPNISDMFVLDQGNAV